SIGSRRDRVCRLSTPCHCAQPRASAAPENPDRKSKPSPRSRARKEGGDLIDRKLRARAACSKRRAWHAVNGARGLILRNKAAAPLGYRQRTVGAVATHACEHHRKRARPVDIGDASKHWIHRRPAEML